MTHVDPTLTADALSASNPSLKRVEAPPSDHAHAPAREAKPLQTPQPRKPRLRIPCWRRVPARCHAVLEPAVAEGLTNVYP